MNRCSFTILNIINGFKKKTIDIRVKYVPKSEQTKEKEVKPKTTKSGSLPRKQNKNISQKLKKLLKNIALSGRGYITK